MIEHINEQPWYDYQRCLIAADALHYFNPDREYGLGSIFQVWVPDSKGVHYSFYALMIANEGELADRYRMCLYREPLVAQRMLRGLPDPKPKRKKLNMRITGYNPKTVIVDDYLKLKKIQ